jgi:hypothetical protein
VELDGIRIGEAASIDMVLAGRSPSAVHVQAAADVPLATLLPVLEGVPRAFSLELVFRGGDAAPLEPSRPPPEWTAEALARAHAVPGLADRANLLAPTIDSAITGGCLPMAATFMAVAGVSPSAKAEIAAAGAAEALEICRCGGADIDALEALLLVALRPEDLRKIPLTLSPRGRALRLPRDGTVADLIRTIAASDPSRPVRVVLGDR